MLHQLFVFGMELVLHQACQLAQTHFHNGTCLDFREFESVHQVLDSFVRSLGGTDDAYHFVDVVRCDDQAFEDVGTFLRLAEFVLGATDDHFVTMVHETLNHILQCQALGASLHEGDVVHAERALESSHLEQLVQYYACVGIALHIDDDAHTFAVGFIVHVRDAFYLLFVHQ